MKKCPWKNNQIEGVWRSRRKEKKMEKEKKTERKKKDWYHIPMWFEYFANLRGKKKDIKHHIIPNDVSYLLLGLKDIAFGKIYERLTKIGPTRTRN